MNSDVIKLQKRHRHPKSEQCKVLYPENTIFEKFLGYFIPLLKIFHKSAKISNNFLFRYLFYDKLREILLIDVKLGTVFNKIFFKFKRDNSTFLKRILIYKCRIKK